MPRVFNGTIREYVTGRRIEQGHRGILTAPPLDPPGRAGRVTTGYPRKAAVGAVFRAFPFLAMTLPRALSSGMNRAEANSMTRELSGDLFDRKGIKDDCRAPDDVKVRVSCGVKTEPTGEGRETTPETGQAC